MARPAVKANVSASASSVTLFASREGVSVRKLHNDSTAILYLDETGGTASATSYTTKIPADGYYEFPRPVADGIITGIWATATGTARTTEVA
jgi:hypothetical protein